MIQQHGRIRLLIEMFLYTTVLLADNEKIRLNQWWRNILSSARSKVSEIGRKILSLVSLTGDRLWQLWSLWKHSASERPDTLST
jgi:hypothetical protein